jgi:hypothetical protein
MDVPALKFFVLFDFERHMLVRIAHQDPELMPYSAADSQQGLSPDVHEINPRPVDMHHADL